MSVGVAIMKSDNDNLNGYGKITWSGTAPNTVQFFKVQYRKTSLPDSPSNYTLFSNNFQVYPSGEPLEPLKIPSLLPDTEYLIRFTNTVSNTIYDKIFRTPISLKAGSNTDKLSQMQIGGKYEGFIGNEYGLPDTYFPSNSGNIFYPFDGGRLAEAYQDYSSLQWLDVNGQQNLYPFDFDFRGNELGTVLDSTLLKYISLPITGNEAGLSMLDLITDSGTGAYNIGIWINPTQDEVDAWVLSGERQYLWYMGRLNSFFALYVEPSDLSIHWIHQNSPGVSSEIVFDEPLEVDTWNRILCRKAFTISNSDFVFYKGLQGSSYTVHNTYTGSLSHIIFPNANDRIYVGCGMRADGSIQVTNSCFKWLTLRGTNILDGGDMYKAVVPVYIDGIISDDADGLVNPFTIPYYNFESINSGGCSFNMPMDAPIGNKFIRIRTAQGLRAVRPLKINDQIIETGYDINFDDDSLTEVQIAQTLANHYNVLSQSWGGAVNGGVSPDNFYVKDRTLIIQANGFIYDGDVQGRNRDTTPKTHTIQNNPIWGTDPRYGLPWKRYTGGCLVSKNYHGYGKYTIRSMRPYGYGVVAGPWTFAYSEFYPTGKQYWDLMSEGVQRRQGSPGDGFYVTDNQEIDEEHRSHEAMWAFDNWDEAAYYIAQQCVDQCHLAIYGDNADYGTYVVIDRTKPSTSSITGQAGLPSNSLLKKSNWTKVADDVVLKWHPLVNWIKHNNWVGETGNGSGLIDPYYLVPYTYTLPDGHTYMNGETFIAKFTDTTFGEATEQQWMDTELRHYADRTELWWGLVDPDTGLSNPVLISTNEYFVPYKVARLTLGMWFPRGIDSSGLLYPPWLPKPETAWSGMDDTVHHYNYRIKRLKFEPFDNATAGGTCLSMPESFPYGLEKPLTVNG